MWAFGQPNFEEIPRQLAVSNAIKTDIKESKRYIAVMQLEVITGVDRNYSESVERLSQAPGHSQFQDVMRQGMEHVQNALLEMRKHMMRISGDTEASDYEGTFDTRLKNMLASHIASDRMASRTATHIAVAGGQMSSDARPAIDLF